MADTDTARAEGKAAGLDLRPPTPNPYAPPAVMPWTRAPHPADENRTAALAAAWREGWREGLDERSGATATADND